MAVAPGRHENKGWGVLMAATALACDLTVVIGNERRLRRAPQIAVENRAA